MDTLDKIKEAISKQKPIEFDYSRSGKVVGRRKGNAHIVFSGTTKEGLHRSWMHIAQTGGVSDTLVTFPDWRMFITDFIQNVEVLDSEPSFQLQEGYNPDAVMYSNIIAKV